VSYSSRAIRSCRIRSGPGSSASLQLHRAVQHLPADSASKALLSHALRLGDQAVEDGRRVLEGLRCVATRSLSLEQALVSLQDKFRFAEGVEFRIVVQGKTRVLNEVVEGEIYRIIREAVVNALRHSGATVIEVDLVYHRRVIRVAIRDNGCGFDLHTIQLARHPHWGLRGMSERADRIGAQLLVWSRSGAGTEIEISIPACSRSDTSTAIRGESIAS
jgi:signal transduction histidine kinase